VYVGRGRKRWLIDYSERMGTTIQKLTVMLYDKLRDSDLRKQAIAEQMRKEAKDG